MRFFPAGVARSWVMSSLGLCFCCIVPLTVGAGRAAAEVYAPPSGFEQPPSSEGDVCPELPEQIAPYEPPPPVEGEESPEVAEGEPVDRQLLREVRLQRIDAITMCRVLAAQFDRLGERQWWSVAELGAARAQRQLTNEKLTALIEQGCDPCKVAVVSEPEGVGDSAEEQYTDRVVSAIDSSGEASKAGLWFIAAVLLIGVFAYPVYRAFIFWRDHV